MKPATPNQGTQRHLVVGGCQWRYYHCPECNLKYCDEYLLIKEGIVDDENVPGTEFYNIEPRVEQLL